MDAIRVCTIAGHDTSGGAGVVRDCVVIQNFGLWPHPVITALTCQSFKRVEQIMPVAPEHVAQQLHSVLSNFPINTIKVGMLYHSATIEVLIEELKKFQPQNVVVDPLLYSSGGEPLLSSDAVTIFYEKLLPLATVITPNRHELQVMANQHFATTHQAVAFARKLSKQYGFNVLLKGGHFDDFQIIDFLISPDTIYQFEHERINLQYSHGTGCTLSTAFACQIALGIEPSLALKQSVNYTLEAFRSYNR